MHRNIFIFHGTEGHPGENWFPWMKVQLESLGHKVFVPQFPSPPVVPAKIDEWHEVLKSYQSHLSEEAVLIGHSLGGVFALRLLERLGHPVHASAFVGTPVGMRPILNYDRDVSFCGFDFDWGKIKKNAGHASVFHSDDDPYVGLKNGEELARRLAVDLDFIPNAGHFNTKAGYTKFPELLARLTPLL